MPWEAWTLVALFTLNVITAVLLIGRQRPPMTPGGAVWALAANGALVLIVLRLAEVA